MAYPIVTTEAVDSRNITHKTYPDRVVSTFNEHPELLVSANSTTAAKERLRVAIRQLQNVGRGGAPLGPLV